LMSTPGLVRASPRGRRTLAALGHFHLLSRQALGGSGSVTLTTLTARRAVGTFSFNAATLAAGAAGRGW
jgi:hypothetical protein